MCITHPHYLCERKDAKVQEEREKKGEKKDAQSL